ncbi:MAG TPA: hypothetical protein VHR47_07350 [Bacillota bacterium]|nr:hypothetical protein [Bacillota bacterium]
MKQESETSMRKETVQLEDGRYLIYYSFDSELPKDEKKTKHGQAVVGKDED